ncbi:hypothetical protein D3C72_792780 [compost metagenome]
MHHPRGQHRRIALAVTVCRLYDCEFVAAEATHHIVFTEHGGNPRGHRHQQGVTGGMSECVIDGLEAVEIEQHDIEGLAGRRQLLQTVFQRLHQQHAVWKSGQRVVMSHMLQLLRHIAYLPQASTLQNRLAQRFDGGRHVADLVPPLLKRRGDICFLAGNPKCRLHQRRDRFQEMPGNHRHKYAGDGQDHDQRGE